MSGEIQSRMLSELKDSYDKTEGSFFYDILKPIAIELSNNKGEVSRVFDKVFVDTAEGEYLDRRVEEQGVDRKKETKASGIVTLTGQAGKLVEQGIEVASDTVSYYTLEESEVGADGAVEVMVECEEYGSIGNCPQGAIKYFPITIQGLTQVNNKSDFTNGYDGESDSELRQRYYEKVQKPATSGNIYDYVGWAKEVQGVGDARVFPLWSGNGTVKVLIIDSNKRGASPELVTAVKDNIELNRPIGADVTVVSAAESFINLEVSLTLSSEYTLEEAKVGIESSIEEHLKEIAFKESYVSYAKVGSLILGQEGVLDYSNLEINGASANVPISDEEIAVLGTLSAT